jgi:signal transduction histidine kinase/HPt (histidine-containing phosphotransfer) domain-containing protein/ActR/RegA family two-component response regulator
MSTGDREDNVGKLQERVELLTREREAAKRVLESAVNSLGFSVVVDESFSSRALLPQVAQKLRSFIQLESMVFLLFSSDGLDFTPAYCDPPESLPFFESEMLPLVEDGTFAWAVDRNKPVVVTARTADGASSGVNGERRILLHSITTQNRTVGMFMGVLGEDDAVILDISFAFFTVLLGSVAGILQNAELYSMIRELNSELRSKIGRLEESERNLADAMRTRDVFLANVSHEVRTPLNGIIGITTLLEETPLNTPQREMIRVLKDESGSLLHLINDLLDFSKMEAGKLVFEETPFNLDELWNSVSDSFLPRASAKKLVFGMKLEESVPSEVSGDPLRLRQVLGNIIGNAVKFTSSGSVHVTGRCLERRSENFLFSVEVCDTGIGISPQEATKLFEPFVQGDASTTRRFGGTGLGLAISKRIVEGMGGNIGFESGEGNGTRFTITVPLRELSAVESTEFTDTETEATQTLPPTASALVVEDNATNKLIAVALLNLIGLQTVETAENGLEAIEKLSSARYDIVLMDLQMPVMDGLEAISVIRDPSSSVLEHGVPVVAMTANVLPGDKERCLAAGMSDYISKPVFLAELRRVVQRFFCMEERASSDEFPSGSADGSIGAGRGDEQPVFRRKILLERMGNDEDLCRHAIELFVKDSEFLLDSIEETLETGDAAEARRMVHALRGASANVEAVVMMRLADGAEQAAAEKDIERVLDALPKLRNARREFIEAVLSAGGMLSDEK